LNKLNTNKKVAIISGGSSDLAVTLEAQLALEISNNAEPMLALAIVLFSLDNNSIESINLAKNALKSNPKYISNDYQAEQLWGKKLQKSAKILFKSNQMKKVVKEAKERSQ